MRNINIIASGKNLFFTYLVIVTHLGEPSIFCLTYASASCHCHDCWDFTRTFDCLDLKEVLAVSFFTVRRKINAALLLKSSASSEQYKLNCYSYWKGGWLYNQSSVKFRRKNWSKEKCRFSCWSDLVCL